MAGRRRRGNGQGTLYRRTERGPWIAAWYDHNSKRIERSTRTTDKAAAERILRKRVTDTALRRDGVIDARADCYTEAECRPLSEHLADFRASLTHKAATPKTVKLVCSRLARVLQLCGASRISDLTASTVQAAIGAIRDGT